MPKRAKNAAKRKQAKDLYCRNQLQQQAIAELLVVTEKTIGRWKKADGWDRERAAYITTKESELRRLYTQLNELQTVIEQREPGHRYANTKEADILSKLSAAIKTLENDVGIAATVQVSMSFLDWFKGRAVDIKPITEGRRSIVQLVCDEMDLYIKGLLA